MPDQHHRHLFLTQEIILREFKLFSGDVFNSVLIDHGRKTLEGRGYFQDFDIRGNPSSEPGRKDVFTDVL